MRDGAQVALLQNTGFNDALWHLRLMAQNALRVANVLANRRLHRPPRYCPILLAFVTNRCNLRCKMCGVCELTSPMDHTPELTTDEWRGVIRSAVRMRTSLMLMSGGEPLLRQDVFDIIRYACDQGIAFHLCTNGTLIDKEKALRLAETGVNTVSVSIESPVKAIHERLRGPGTFDRAVQGVRLLREHAPNVNIGVNYLITSANFLNMAEMIPFVESLGAHQLKYAPIHTNLLHKRKRIGDYGDLLFGEEDLEELDREMRLLMKAAAQNRLLTTSPMFLSKISSFYSRPSKFRCYAGYAACAVDPFGVVTPCVDMDGSLSVRDRPLEAIWRSPEFQVQRREVHRCNSSCWDTTNAELSIRLRVRSLIRDLALTWKDIGFYYGKDGS